MTIKKENYFWILTNLICTIILVFAFLMESPFLLIASFLLLLIFEWINYFFVIYNNDKYYIKYLYIFLTFTFFMIFGIIQFINSFMILLFLVFLLFYVLDISLIFTHKKYFFNKRTKYRILYNSLFIIFHYVLIQISLIFVAATTFSI